MKQYICLDIGGTYLKYGILTSGGRFLVKGKVPTHAERGGCARAGERDCGGVP